MIDNIPKLSQNLLEMLNDDEYYDITIEVGNDPYVKVFHAHMVILNYRSPYLRRVLSTNEKKNDGTLNNIKLPNISPEIFQIVLRYIYEGRLSLEDYDSSDIIKILITANKLSLRELIPYLELYLIENKTNWMEKNFENLLISLIQNNYLQISETQIWENVLKWGIAQNPELSSDPSSYSNEDFNALKNTLQSIFE
ncbi:BTB/POZ protein [Glomus cerebriforme]|uniref:BTB/POZ protein n=1 Tax=Glomus cerebriforme TaxID=658196 RepID=A0A397T029_9GLOM|nr:BTB/POZ protein [Glomus cerebriforme]